MKENMIPQKQRFNNSCIMEYILNIITSHTDTKRINACRNYLRVTFLSEISNIKGTALITGSLIGDKSKIVNSNLGWPNQSKPNISTWLLWSRTIKRIYCAQSQSGLLRPSKRLGQWTKNQTQSTQQHNFLYSPSTKEIYFRQTSSYEQWFVSPIK